MASTLRFRLSFGLTMVLLASAWSARLAATDQVGLGQIDPDGVSHARIVVPMVFPVLGKCSWNDTFLASRGGGTRRHLGQDVMAPKMRQMAAAFDGVAYPRASGSHNTLTIVGDNGWSAVYMHINNDTPGSDDGLGSAKFAFAAGLTSGSRVSAGQMVAWVGDSGNAEGTAPHLHFELRSNSGNAAINPAPSLGSAQRVANPSPAQVERPVYRDSNGLATGDIRVSGTIVAVDQATMTLTMNVDTVVLPDHWFNSLSPARRKVVSISSQTRIQSSPGCAAAATLAEARVGSRVAAIGPNRGEGSTLTATRLVLNVEVTAGEADTSSSTPQQPFMTADEQKGLALLNADRALQGLPALIADATLTAVARAHAEDMTTQGYVSHTNKLGQSPGDRLRAAGIKNSPWGENIAVNGSVEAAEASWMQSPGHRSNILSTAHTHVGVGLARNQAGQLYAVQLFVGGGRYVGCQAGRAQ